MYKSVNVSTLLFIKQERCWWYRLGLIPQSMTRSPRIFTENWENKDHSKNEFVSVLHTYTQIQQIKMCFSPHLQSVFSICCVSSMWPCQEELKDLRSLIISFSLGLRRVLMDNQHSISGWHFPPAYQLLCLCAGVIFGPLITPWPLAQHRDKQHKKLPNNRPCTLQILLLRFKS